MKFAAPRLYRPSRLTLLGSKIRMVLKDDEPWFVALDVCAVLGLKNSSEVIQHLEDDEKAILQPQEGVISSYPLSLTVKLAGGPQPLAIISLSGFFGIVFRSKNHSVKVELRKWGANRIMSSPVVDWRYDGGNTLDRFDPGNVRLALDALDVVLATDSRRRHDARGRRPRYILNFRNNEVLRWTGEVGQELLREVQLKLAYFPFKGTWRHEIEGEFLRNSYDPTTGEVFRNVRVNPNIDRIEFGPRKLGVVVKPEE